MAAILFPVFARARENARRASCQSNLKQIGLGFAQYTQDYDEKLPIWYNGAYTAPSGGWSMNIQPYLKSTQIYQCPSESNGPSSDPANVGYSDYAYNLWLGFPGSRSLSYLTQSALTVQVMDSRGAQTSTTWTGTSLTFEEGGPYGTAGDPTPHLANFTETASTTRHLEGQNFLFCDGHVKWFKGNSNGSSSAVYSICTPSALGGSLISDCGTPSTTGPFSGNSPTFNLTP